MWEFTKFFYTVACCKIFLFLFTFWSPDARGGEGGMLSNVKLGKWFKWEFWHYCVWKSILFCYWMIKWSMSVWWYDWWNVRWSSHSWMSDVIVMGLCLGGPGPFLIHQPLTIWIQNHQYACPFTYSNQDWYFTVFFVFVCSSIFAVIFNSW